MLSGHSKDIVDLSWSENNHDLLVTASHDKKVIIWNAVSKKIQKPLHVFTFPDIVTCVSFKPGFEESFGVKDQVVATGCFDKIVRLWSLHQNKVINYNDVPHHITAISFSLDGERLVVGTIKGSIYIFESTNSFTKLMLLETMNVKNRRGRFSKGRKVNEIKFTLN